MVYRGPVLAEDQGGGGVGNPQLVWVDWIFGETLIVGLEVGEPDDFDLRGLSLRLWTHVVAGPDRVVLARGCNTGALLTTRLFPRFEGAGKGWEGVNVGSICLDSMANEKIFHNNML